MIRFLFKLFSQLPFGFFYALSDLAYFILYHVTHYRQKVVAENIDRAFPEKTATEKAAIVKQFYQNFTDTFAESVKLYTLPVKKMQERCDIDVSTLQALLEKGRPVQLLMAHQFNWEYIILMLPTICKAPFYLVYRPIEHAAINQIYLELRGRTGATLVSADAFLKDRETIFSKPSALMLVADQNPGKIDKAVWLNFFGKPAPFFTGPAKGAVKYGTAVVMMQVKRTQRGHYQLTSRVITEDASAYSPEQLALLYKNEVERVIKEDPSNYLWSHRRWRHEWKPEYGPVLN